MNPEPLLLVPATGEPPLPDSFAIAIRPTAARISYLLGLFDQLATVQQVNPAIESITVLDNDVELVLDPRLRMRENSPLAHVARVMADVEQNVFIDDAIARLRNRRPPTIARIVVRKGYMEWSGFGPERWDSSPLWPSALLYMWLMIAEQHQAEGIFERLAEVQPGMAVEALEKGIAFDYPEVMIRNVGAVSARAATAMLEAEEREVRERAIGQLGRLTQTAS